MQAISQDLLGLLADPETHEPLVPATDAELRALKQALASGAARRHDGKQPSDRFEGALLSQHKKVAYLVEDGIANLLVDERLELNEALAAS